MPQSLSLPTAIITMSSPTSKSSWLEKILITVKTYPHPSKTYDELVCTAGLREDGSWVRLYPVRFRYMSYAKQYEKYDWIEAEVERNEVKDSRPETLRPLRDAEGDEKIRKVGHITTEEGWLQRKEIVLKSVVPSLCGLLKDCKERGTSLGTVKPASIDALMIEKTEAEWKPEWKKLFAQQNLFGEDRKPLVKVPYKFSYRFRCDDPECKGHTMQITDWEIHQLYLNCLAASEGDENLALKKVREKYEQEFLERCDIYLFLGTTLEFQKKNAPNPFLIIGVFYPPIAPPSLF